MGAAFEGAAIETGCYVIAAAQTGTHAVQAGKTRQTYGHSLVVDPWGEVVADLGTEPTQASKITLVDIDLRAVSKTRERIPSLTHDRDFSGPEIYEPTN